MRVDVGPFGGNLLEVAGVISKLTTDLSFNHSFTIFTTCFSSSDGSVIILTPSLASQCGFRIKMFPPGTAVIYASIQNCFAENVVMKLEVPHQLHQICH